MNSKDNGHAPKRAILYARVSTQKQVDEGYSLRQQMEALREYAEREGYEIFSEVEEYGYTGADLDRPALDRVRDLVALGGVDAVTVQDRDRLARRHIHHVLLEHEFAQKGTVVRAITDWGDDTPEGRLLNNIRDAVAEYERELIKERTRRGRLQAAREGKVVIASSPPQGFVYDRGSENYRVNEPAMAVVRRIFSMIGDEGYSLSRVKRTFENEGVPTAKGTKLWRITTIKRLIMLDAYKPHTFKEVEALVRPAVARTLDPTLSYGISYYTHGEEKIAVPIPDAGIPRETVEAARRRVSENVRVSRANDRYWPLSGIAFCACGRRLACRVVKRGYGTYYYYACPRHNEPADRCDNRKWHPASELEYDVFWAVWPLVAEPETLKERTRAYIEAEKKALRHSEEAVLAALKTLEEAKATRERYQEMAARNLITLEELEDRLLQLDKQRRGAEAELERLREPQAALEALECLDYDSMAPVALIRMRHTDEELMDDLYRDLRLRVTVAPDGGVAISGALGSQIVSVGISAR